MSEPFAVFPNTDYAFGEIVTHPANPYLVKTSPFILLGVGFSRGIENLCLIAYSKRTHDGAYTVPSVERLIKTRVPFLTLEELLTHDNAIVRLCTGWLLSGNISEYNLFLRKAASVAVPLYNYDGTSYGIKT